MYSYARDDGIVWGHILEMNTLFTILSAFIWLLTWIWFDTWAKISHLVNSFQSVYSYNFSPIYMYVLMCLGRLPYKQNCLPHCNSYGVPHVCVLTWLSWLPDTQNCLPCGGHSCDISPVYVLIYVWQGNHTQRTVFIWLFSCMCPDVLTRLHTHWTICPAFIFLHSLCSHECGKTTRHIELYTTICACICLLSSMTGKATRHTITWLRSWVCLHVCQGLKNGFAESYW